MANLMRRNDKDNGTFPSFFNRYWNNDFFGNFTEADLPAVNVKENDKEFKLEISAAGYDKGEIQVKVDNDILTISGKKEMRNEGGEDKDKVLRQEFRSSSFYRSFSLPENIDTDKIEAVQKKWSFGYYFTQNGKSTGR
ncbi:MAG: Hsp20/alpha crystallin family protein [Tannerellaceae bacterium]|nr:Hsp20/alpha crystallin family protein [Tannerellaceae bacterium]